jgi:hypothetical protein
MFILLLAQVHIVHPIIISRSNVHCRTTEHSLLLLRTFIINLGDKRRLRNTNMFVICVPWRQWLILHIVCSFFLRVDLHFVVSGVLLLLLFIIVVVILIISTWQYCNDPRQKSRTAFSLFQLTFVDGLWLILTVKYVVDDDDNQNWTQLPRRSVQWAPIDW